MHLDQIRNLTHFCLYFCNGEHGLAWAYLGIGMISRRGVWNTYKILV